MRHKFNLDDQALDGYSVLVYGINASGKTHLLGDFLRTEQETGPVRFINVAGEDGSLTIKGMGLGEVAETIEGIDDIMGAIKEYKDLKLQACAIDSLGPLSSWLRVKLFGSNRMPGNPDEWTKLHLAMYNLIMELKACAKYIMCASIADRSGDQVTEKSYVTPDLPGRQARISAGWFDFVGYLEAIPLANKVKRTFNMVPNATFTVRQRLPRQVSSVIELPQGPGGWSTIKAAIEGGWK